MMKLISITAVVFTLFYQCSEQIAGGAGGETTNGIVGMIRNSDNTPATDAVIRLFPSEYDPVKGPPLPDNFVDTVDTKGNYRFSSIDSGTYTILSRNRQTASSALKRDISVNNDSVTTAPVATLTGSGSITADFSSNEEAKGKYIYIPGTDISSRVNSDGSVFLNNIPAGTLSVILLAIDDNEKQNILSNEITIPSGDTTAIALPFWKYNRRLTLNTTPDGADITETIYNFPVLVRLNGENFNFTQANFSGADIRFASAEGTPLAYEIERWDQSSRLAEVWVKVDTIYGNSNSRTITMYWGNPEVSGTSNSTMVFDTTAHFQGVWHMEQDANTTVRDATINHYNATPIGMNETSSIDKGMIGIARRFDGISSYLLLEGTADSKLAFPQNASFTLSAWVYTGIIDSLAHYIISKSTYSYSLLLSKTQRWELFDVEDDSGLQSVYAEPVLKQWKLLTGVCDGEDMYLYVDGVCVDSIREIKPGLSFDPTFDVHIGKRADLDTYGYWDGLLDEVRILNTAVSADWIKLCYMNQHENKLIVFE